MADTVFMTKRTAPAILLALAVLASPVALPGPVSAGGGHRATSGAKVDAYRPDAWIRLCGLSTGCTINPGPHPWRGNNIYNATGALQKVGVRLDNGEGVRFWIAIENDGSNADTIRVQGCSGNRRFYLNAVLIGLWKRPYWRAVKITKAFKQGTAQFTFPPTTTDKRVYLTVNFVTPTPAVGVSYRCPITVISQGSTTTRDTVVATMTTY
jgi:hypothetical protein